MNSNVENKLRQNEGSLKMFLVVIITICFPPILMFGFFIVNPREEVVVLREFVSWLFA